MKTLMVIILIINTLALISIYSLIKMLLNEIMDIGLEIKGREILSVVDKLKETKKAKGSK